MIHDKDQAVEAMIVALSQGESPIALADYAGPPPPAEFYLSLMREMLDDDGQAMGAVTFGTANESGMLPLANFDAQEALAMLIAARVVGVIPKVAWVAATSDMWHRRFTDGTTPDDVRHGTLEEMHNAGDTSVTEALMAMCVAPDGPGYDVLQPYTRTEDGIVWGEVENLSEAEHHGALNELMTLLVSV